MRRSKTGVQGEVVGVIGRNGAGKSTLLKLPGARHDAHGRAAPRTAAGLARSWKSEPDFTRSLRVASRTLISAGRFWECGGRRFVFGSTRSWRSPRSRTSLTRRSSAIQAAWRCGSHPQSRPFLQPEALLVDEVLAVGDLEFRKKCLGRIGEVSQEDGRTVLFVSHDLNAVLSTCSRALLIDHGRIDRDGPALDVVARYEAIQSRAARVDGEFVRSAPNPRFPLPVFAAAQIETRGGTGGHVVHGDPLRLVIETSDVLEGQRFGIDVRILDSRNRPVTYIASAEMQGATFAAGDVVVLDIPFLPFLPGSYLIELSAQTTGTTLDHWIGEIGFDVIRFDPFEIGSMFAPSHETGSVVPAHRWSSRAGSRDDSAR